MSLLSRKEERYIGNFLLHVAKDKTYDLSYLVIYFITNWMLIPLSQNQNKIKRPHHNHIECFELFEVGFTLGSKTKKIII